jgi:prevent-host-death family protein
MASNETVPATDTVVTATELSRNLSDILNRVRYRGERFVILRNGEEIAVLEPHKEASAATMGDLVQIIEKHGPLDDEFMSDIEAARAALLPEEPPAWGS